MLAELLFRLTHLNLLDHRLFRAGAASLLAFAIVFHLMPSFIAFLRRLDATSDFDAQPEKKSPPIFGGALLVVAVILSTLCFAKLNPYTGSILVIMIAYSLIGGIDDALKIRNKRLVALGKVEQKSYQDKADGLTASSRLKLYFLFSLVVAVFAYKFIPNLTGHLTVPFVKPALWHPHLPNWAFVLLISFVTTSTANGANFTDGLDTLVSVPLITTALFVGVVAYISGNAIFSRYLLIPHLPGVDELMPIAAAMIGALLAYIWYNCPPAEIYMGDSGSIGLGGAIGMMFVLVKAELFLPIVGIIFVAEALSVALQMLGFKLTRRFSKDHVGLRLFRKAPLHHHFQLEWQSSFPAGVAVNSKVIWRFHLISILAFILGALIFFKVR